MQELSRQLLSRELERCRPWIEAALKRGLGTHEFEDIVAATQSGDMQLWPAPTGCVVTEIQVYPRKKILNVFLGGGSLQGILELEAEVAAWGKAKGCEIMTAQGRSGWKRAAGWAQAGIIIKRSLK